MGGMYRDVWNNIVRGTFKLLEKQELMWCLEEIILACIYFLYIEVFYMMQNYKLL